MSDRRSSAGRSPLIDRLRDRAWLGASWLPRWRDEGFLLAVDPDPEMLTLTAVGGKVEVGESFADAARREWEEETGCPAPQPVLVSKPIWMGAPEDPTADTEGAAAVLQTVPTAGTPAPRPLWILVFLTCTELVPRPVEKHPEMGGELTRLSGAMLETSPQITRGTGPVRGGISEAPLRLGRGDCDA